MNWLDMEMNAAVRSVRQSHLDRLTSLGVLPKAIASLGMVQPPFGVSTIKREMEYRYEPDPMGLPCMVMPVTLPERFEAFGCDHETIEILDLIAIRTSSPAAWLWRVGDGWALGAQHLIEPSDEAVRIVATPLEWLALAGQAVCVLDWSEDSPIWALLHQGPDLVVDDDALRMMLQAAFRRSATTLRFRSSTHAA